MAGVDGLRYVTVVERVVVGHVINGCGLSDLALDVDGEGFYQFCSPKRIDRSF
jgi:hypothetical protein